MDSETMKHEEFCNGCKHANSCSNAYERIGKVAGPSVAWKVFFVFLLPLLVFASFLGLFQWFLAEVIAGEKIRTAASFALAVAVVMAVIRLVKYTLDGSKNRPKKKI